jgi:hypothetical protein
VLPDLPQIDEAVDRAQQVVGRDMLFQRKLIEQSNLIDLPLTHHRRHSSSNDRSESATTDHRNLTLFQHNQPEGTVCVPFWQGLSFDGRHKSHVRPPRIIFGRKK